MSTSVPAVTGYYPTTAPTAAAVPTPVTVNVATPAASVATPTIAADSSTFSAASLSQGAILPTSGRAILAGAAKAFPAGTQAAIGAASAIAANTSASMGKEVARVVGEAGEPLFKLTWGIVQNVADTVGALLTFRVGDAIKGIGNLFKDGAVNTGQVVKRAAEPAMLTAAVSGGNRLGLGGAIGAGLSTGLKALKSSAVWAIPSAAINAFVDYKYKDQTDTKRLATNFVADVVGYTATGMAGAAVGAAVGSMTMPIIGTVVGAGVGILLGMAHEKITRPMISDALRDQLG